MNRKLLLILILATSLGISNAGAQTGITVETNFDLFEQGQLVLITGNAEEKSVDIKVKDPTGISILVRLITTDSDGNFELEFRISQTATLGNYQVVASTIIDNNNCCLFTEFVFPKRYLRSSFLISSVESDLSETKYHPFFCNSSAFVCGSNPLSWIMLGFCSKH